jgi:aminoglycoside/choline kinase family phosphotransferase
VTETATPDAVADYLTRRGLTDAPVVALTGDASDRRYFRVRPRNAPPFVIAVHGSPFAPGSLPFVNVATLFASMPVPVPRVLDEAGDIGVLALDDLGDLTLQAHLGGAPRSEWTARYEEAVSLIAVFQRRGRELVDPRFLPYGIAFDVQKLLWELDYFLKYFLEAYRGVSLTRSARANLQSHFANLASELAAEPRVLCHRDYHSRNLMLHEGRLVVIDFQDARMGPDTYDLVSLLRDSYVEVPADLVDHLIRRFMTEVGDPSDPTVFRKRFDTMALQRNMKALGTFGYQAAVRNNPVYTQYIPRTLRHIEQTLGKHDRFAAFANDLSAHLGELHR